METKPPTITDKVACQMIQIIKQKGLTWPEVLEIAEAMVYWANKLPDDEAREQADRILNPMRQEPEWEPGCKECEGETE